MAECLFVCRELHFSGICVAIHYQKEKISFLQYSYRIPLRLDPHDVSLLWTLWMEATRDCTQYLYEFQVRRDHQSRGFLSDAGRNIVFLFLRCYQAYLCIPAAEIFSPTAPHRKTVCRIELPKIANQPAFSI